VSGSSIGVRKGQIDHGAIVDPTANVWDLAQIRSSAIVGAESNIGRAAYIGSGVVVGRRCKVQNLAQIFEPAVLEDGTFVGPGAILTNDRSPRAVNPDGSLKSVSDWQPVGVYVETGASIGAGAVCVAPVRIGRWAMIAAGAVLAVDAKPYGLYVGVPAQHVGWVGPAGIRLMPNQDGSFQCPATNRTFLLDEEGFLSALP